MLTGFGPGLPEKRGKHRGSVKIHRTLLQGRPLARDSRELLCSLNRPVSQKTVSQPASQTAAYPNAESRQAALHQHGARLVSHNPNSQTGSSSGQTNSHPLSQEVHCSIKSRLFSPFAVLSIRQRLGSQESSFSPKGIAQRFEICLFAFLLRVGWEINTTLAYTSIKIWSWSKKLLVWLRLA